MATTRRPHVWAGRLHPKRRIEGMLARTCVLLRSPADRKIVHRHECGGNAISQSHSLGLGQNGAISVAAGIEPSLGDEDTAKSNRSNKWESWPCLPARQPHEPRLRFWFVHTPTPAFGRECARRTLPELSSQD